MTGGAGYAIMLYTSYIQHRMNESSLENKTGDVAKQQDSQGPKGPISRRDFLKYVGAFALGAAAGFKLDPNYNSVAEAGTSFELNEEELIQRIIENREKFGLRTDEKWVEGLLSQTSEELATFENFDIEGLSDSVTSLGELFDYLQMILAGHRVIGKAEDVDTSSCLFGCGIYGIYPQGRVLTINVDDVAEVREASRFVLGFVHELIHVFDAELSPQSFTREMALRLIDLKYEVLSRVMELNITPNIFELTGSYSLRQNISIESYGGDANELYFKFGYRVAYSVKENDLKDNILPLDIEIGEEVQSIVEDALIDADRKHVDMSVAISVGRKLWEKYGKSDSKKFDSPVGKLSLFRYINYYGGMNRVLAESFAQVMSYLLLANQESFEKFTHNHLDNEQMRAFYNSLSQNHSYLGEYPALFLSAIRGEEITDERAAEILELLLDIPEDITQKRLREAQDYTKPPESEPGDNGMLEERLIDIYMSKDLETNHSDYLRELFDKKDAPGINLVVEWYSARRIIAMYLNSKPVERDKLHIWDKQDLRYTLNNGANFPILLELQEDNGLSVESIERLEEIVSELNDKITFAAQKEGVSDLTLEYIRSLPPFVEQ